MKRRSNNKNGWVNFPVDDPSWHNTQEGGLFVKLVVCDDREYNDRFGICSGVFVHDRLSELLIADDKRPLPKSDFKKSDFLNQEEYAAACENYYADLSRWEEYHYPALNDKEERDYTSRSYLAVIIMGSTGWSGYKADVGLWNCTYNDLTEDGKNLYSSIQKLYPNCTLHLLTFLDT